VNVVMHRFSRISVALASDFWTELSLCDPGCRDGHPPDPDPELPQAACYQSPAGTARVRYACVQAP